MEKLPTKPGSPSRQTRTDEGGGGTTSSTHTGRIEGKVPQETRHEDRVRAMAAEASSAGMEPCSAEGKGNEGNEMGIGAMLAEERGILSPGGSGTAQAVVVWRLTGVEPRGRATATRSTCTSQQIPWRWIKNEKGSCTSHPGALVAVEPIQGFHVVGTDGLRGTLIRH